MKKKPIIAFFVIMLVGLTYSTHDLQANPLPDTGTLSCYNQTQAIDCPQSGEPFYGQDAHYTINPHQFIKFDSDGKALTPSATQWSMVLDQATGLMWEIKTIDGSLVDRSRQVMWYSSDPSLTRPGEAGKYNNGENTELYVQALNSTKFGGFSDWRLPDITELKTIVDLSQVNPSIYTQYFPLSQAGEYWTYQSHETSVSQAWCVHFYDAHEVPQDKGDLFFVRAVRSIYPIHSNLHFFINTDNTVTDTKTGLMWQRQISSSPQPWEYALENCENTTDSGHTDWRLPTLIELQSIVNYNRISALPIDPINFPDLPSENFWTSTPSQQLGFIYNINFNDGTSQTQEAQTELYYRAVRGGQLASSEIIAIQSPTQGRAYTIGSTLEITWNSDGSGDFVQIEVSRQGGRINTFEMINDGTDNDGFYEWEITPPASVNCVIKVTPLQNTDRQNSAGLFSIVDTTPPTISDIFSTSTLIGETSQSIAYTVNDTDGGPIMVIANSSNTNLVPLENIRLGYTSPYNYAVYDGQYLYDTKYLTITPASGQSGIAMITLTVYDSGLLSKESVFQMTVGDMRSALIQLYEQTNGDEWYNNSGWKTPPLHTDGFGMPQTECSWNGVTCDSYGQVLQIDLINNNLVGTLPVDIGNLQSLVQLNLSNNQLSGEIPVNLSLLRNLQELRLDNNSLTGIVPNQLFQLSGLQILQLNNNQLTGSIGSRISSMQSLLSVNISHNQFTGDFPTGILSLYNLQQLDISHNYLSGLIPQGLSYLGYLQMINISGNQFSGNLPSDIKNLSMLSDHQSDFRYNSLSTQEQDLADFISSKQIDNDNWQSTQTLVPQNLNVLNSTSDMIHFSWIPVDYTMHDGGYEICCANYISGHYENCKVVSNKLNNSYEMPGFKPETTYYCQIRSFTLPHNDNPSQLYSDFSSPLSETTQKQEIIWNTMETQTNNWLNSVWGTSSDNVFVVGNESTILRYNGSEWLSMTCTTQTNLHTVYGLSESDIVAVGADGTMHYYDGNHFEQQQALVDDFLWALWGQDTIMYAVGADGTMLKRTDQIWRSISSNTSVDLRDIWGSALDDIFVVGAQGTILHYNGSSWITMESNTTTDLRCVYGFSSNNVYAGGYLGTLLHYNGTEWTAVDLGESIHIMDIWGSNENSVFAVGDQGSIFYYDSLSWQKMESGSSNPLRGIWGSSSTDVFTVGYDGTILRLGTSVPFISYISSQETYINIEKQVQFTVRSTMTPPDKLGLTARSSNSDLIPWDSEHLSFQGLSSTRYLTVKPAHSQYGEADIVITVTSPNGLTASTQFHMTVHNQVIISTEERNALESLYQSTNGNSWKNNSNWLGDLSTECSWYGVVCENNAHIIKIILPENDLSGTIPNDLVNIRYLKELDLHGNHLTGILPSTIGDLTEMDSIDLSDNMISGSIPEEWGQIEGLLYLKLNNNQLSGNIPSTIGNMQYLQSIRFESNQFSGSIPAKIKHLAFIVDGQSDFRYNALYTNDDSIRIFVNNIQQGGDWESTQTVAPTEIDFNNIGAYAVSLSWAPISYSTNDGGYVVYYADDPGGLFRIIGPTSSKSNNSINVTGLLPETNYYFKVRTLSSPHAYNENSVYSDFSDITYTTTKDPATLPLWKNGSFETTDFYGWIEDNDFEVVESGRSLGSIWDQFFSIEATDGNYAAVHESSGLIGTVQLSQELYIPAGGASLTFDYRMGWDLTSGYSTQPRQFKISIYPENSDTALITHLIKEVAPNTKLLDSGIQSGNIDVSEFSCQSVRISFEFYYPEQNSSLSLLLLDNVKLTSLYSNVLEIFLPDSITEGDGIVYNAAKIQLPKVFQQDLSIHIIASTSSIIIPDQVIIPKGQKQAYFNIASADDSIINGRQLVSVSIEDTEWAACKKTMWLYDNDDEWQSLNSGTQNHLYSVWGRSSDDIYAVGRNGQIIHFDGSNWKNMESNTQSDLKAIWGDANQLYTAGDDGTILSYENNNWIRVNTSFTTSLTGIWGADGHVFAAGLYGVFLEKGNNNWIERTLSNTSDKPVFLGGNDQSIYMISQSEIYTYTLGDWIPVSISTTQVMTDIRGNDKDQWVFVGENGSILANTGSGWQTATSNTQQNLNAVSTSDNIFYAVGNSGTILRTDNPDTWIVMNSQSTVHLHDVWVESKNNAFAVGDNGTILRYSGPDIQGIQDADSYVAGEILTVANMISFPAHVASITLCVNIPDGWTYKGTDANARVVLDTNNNPIFSWANGLLSPMIFGYQLNVPKGATDSVEITSKMSFIFESGERGEKDMLPSPLFLEKGTLKHELNIVLNKTDAGYVSGSGLMCPPLCSALFDSTEYIQIKASSVSHYDFDYWLDTETQTILSDPMISITLSHNKTYEVFFKVNQSSKIPEIKYPLNGEILDTHYVHLEVMPFEDPENDAHKLTEWRIYRADRPNICTGIFLDNCIQSESYYLTQYYLNDLISGMQYIWDVGYMDEGSEVLVRSKQNRFSIGTKVTDKTITIESGLEQEDYQMVSIPMWIDNPSAPTAFKDTLSSGYDPRYVKIGLFNPVLNQYIQYNSDMEILPGKAFWVLSRSDMQFSVSGVRVSTTEEIDVPLYYGVDLQNGWNMIGSPTQKDYYWDLLIVVPYNSNGEMINENGDVIQAQDLKTIAAWGPDNPFIEPQLWRWEKGVYYESSEESSYYSKYIIHAYSGYWIRAKQSNVWLRFPVNAQAIVKRSNHSRSTEQWIASETSSSPPSPMDGFSTASTDISKGCFISAVRSGIGMTFWSFLLIFAFLFRSVSLKIKHFFI